MVIASSIIFKETAFSVADNKGEFIWKTDSINPYDKGATGSLQKQHSRMQMPSIFHYSDPKNCLGKCSS